MKKVFDYMKIKIIFEIDEPMTIMRVEYPDFGGVNRFLGWARCHDGDLFDVQTGMMKAFEMSKKKYPHNYSHELIIEITDWIKQQHYSESIDKFIDNRVKRHPEEFEELEKEEQRRKRIDAICNWLARDESGVTKVGQDHALDSIVYASTVAVLKEKEQLKASVNKDCTDAINALAKRYPGLTFKLDYEPK